MWPNQLSSPRTSSRKQTPSPSHAWQAVQTVQQTSQVSEIWAFQLYCQQQHVHGENFAQSPVPKVTDTPVPRAAIAPGCPSSILLVQGYFYLSPFMHLTRSWDPIAQRYIAKNSVSSRRLFPKLLLLSSLMIIITEFRLSGHFKKACDPSLGTERLKTGPSYTSQLGRLQVFSSGLNQTYTISNSVSKKISETYYKNKQTNHGSYRWEGEKEFQRGNKNCICSSTELLCLQFN